MLTEPIITRVLDKMQATSLDSSLPPVRVVNAADFPVLRYDGERRTLYAAAKPSLQGGGGGGGAPGVALRTRATLKADIFRDRYHAIKQRLLRNDVFTPPVLHRVNDTGAKEFYEMTPLDSLSGSSEDVCVLAMIVTLPEGGYGLEDLDATVPCTFANPVTSGGMFTENTLALIEGRMVDSVFVVEYVTMPVAEDKKKSMTSLGSVSDPYGGAASAEETARLAALEGEDPNGLVVLSDVWLDRPKTFERLASLFQGMAPLEPCGFVFIGNFTSVPYQTLPDAPGDHPGDPRKSPLVQVAGFFDRLYELIASFPDMAAASHFIFVPGPNDPGLGKILPRAPLPSSVLGRLPSLPNVHFASNPCRIRYYSQVITVFREDLVHKLRRNCVLPTNLVDTKLLHEHVVKTLVDQSHLLPIPLTAQPVYWAHASALNLFPSPDLLILADPYIHYQAVYEGVIAVNPSSFATEFTFVLYKPNGVPGDGDVQFSRVHTSAAPEVTYESEGDEDEEGEEVQDAKELAIAEGHAGTEDGGFVIAYENESDESDDDILGVGSGRLTANRGPSSGVERAAQIARTAQARELSPAAFDEGLPAVEAVAQVVDEEFGDVDDGFDGEGERGESPNPLSSSPLIQKTRVAGSGSGSGSGGRLARLELSLSLSDSDGEGESVAAMEVEGADVDDDATYDDDATMSLPSATPLSQALLRSMDVEGDE